jgi:pimeloyl-ACP methyl ester carboxylesterase
MRRSSPDQPFNPQMRVESKLPFRCVLPELERRGQSMSAGGINWYRNMDRNWQILADVDPIINRPALMIYGERDMILKSENLADFVPTVDVTSLDCGHWI